MAIFFDESYYLKSKLAQLESVGEKDANGNAYTLDSLKQAISDAGMTPETHYQTYGRTEQLNPNAYFNEAEYLIAKTMQVNSIAQDGRTNWTVDEVKAAIEDIGLTPAEHYEVYGGHETDAKGNLINPSNAFDANAYVAAKLYQLQTSGTEEEKAEWAGKTAADVVAAIAENGMSPVSHYEMFGATEANAGDVPLVQTVPVAQRVENDPARAEVTGELVPSNYNAPTPPPADVTSDEAAPVTKPADVGGKADTAISPEVVVPKAPVPVPGDPDYVAPPANIVDTNDNPVVVVPPATAGGEPQFGVVGADGTVNGVDSAGNPTDTVIGKVDDTGTVTPVEPRPEPTPDPTPPSDTTPPSPPDFANPIAGDNVIDRHELLSGVALTGTAEAGSTVKIVISDGNNETTDVTLTGKANDHGEFSLTLTPENASSLKDGTLTLEATATDAAGNTSATATNTEITLDAALDATYAAAQSLGETQLGLKAPDGFVGTKPTLNQLMEELQTVYDKVTKGTDGDYASVDDLEKDAPNFAKLVHFYSDHTVNQTVIAPSSGATPGVLNLSVHDVYGGGLSLSLAALNAATATGGRIAALVDILGKAQFDLPVIKATATDVVNLEVNKVGSTITEAIDSTLWHNDITFAKLVGLIPEVKPIAVDANTQNLDLRLAADGDTSTVNLMEVRGTVEDITFSGTKGRFGINVDTSSVKNIDASNLTDDHSGVYVNTAQIGVTIPLSDGKTVSIGFHADVADALAFTGSAGNDLLVMTQEKYTTATTLNGGEGTDTLALLGTSEESSPIAVTASNNLSGFEKLALVDISDSSVTGSFKIEDASQFTGITEFITTNSLAIGGLENNTEISVVNFMAYNVNLDLTAKNAGSAVTLNVAMTDHFLMHPESLTGGEVIGHSRAVLINADNITQLTLTGKDANATILLTTAALKDLRGNSIDVSGYVGDIQYESGWTYNDSDHTLTQNGIIVTLYGVQNDTTVSEGQII